MEKPDKFEVVAINDLFDADMLAYMFKYDSTQGRFPGKVVAKGTAIVVNGKEIPILAEKDPAKLPWGKLGVDVVLESTGRFTSRAADGKPGYDSHLAAGAKRVLLSAPAKDKPDATIVLGVNDDLLKRGDEVHLQRLLHDQLAGPGLQGAAREDRHRQGPDDHGPRLHQRPGDPGHAVQGQAPRPGGRHQHRALDHRRRQGPGRGDPGPEGQAARLRPARPGARPARSPT